MRHAIEANMLSQIQRPTGFKSNMFGLNHHLDRYEELDVMDILNNPNESPDIDRVGQRARIEESW